MKVKIYLGSDETYTTGSSEYKVEFVSEPTTSDSISWNWYPNYPVTSTYSTVTIPLLAIPTPYSNNQMAADFGSFVTGLTSNFDGTYASGPQTYIVANNGSPIFGLTGLGTYSTFISVATQSVTTTRFDEIDMYDDETINFTSKLSDIEKLSSVFTDFTNSFTVPATAKNSDIFKHYYDVDIYNTFNANIRVLGYLEIDTFPLRYGKIQLEGIQLKEHRPDSYKITFYGGLVQLSDLFGNDTINNLDYDEDKNKVWDSLSRYDYVYDETNFLKTMNKPDFMNGDIITPLIAYADRDWNYGTSDATDISTDTGSMKDSELKQALRIIRILEGIETKYNISFTRNFFGKSVFNNLYMWLNSTNDYGFKMDIITPITQWQPAGLGRGYIATADTTTDIVTIAMLPSPFRPDTFNFSVYFPFSASPQNLHSIDGEAFTATIYYIDQRPGKVGNIFYSEAKNFTNSDIHNWQKIFSASELGMSETEPLMFKIEFTFSRPVAYNKIRLNALFSYLPPNDMFLYEDRSDNVYGTGAFPIKTIIPKMKVIDFIQGIMKAFKLVIRPVTGNIFYVNTLNGYYSDGNLLNISEYVDNTSVNIERPLIYKTINFKFQETSNALGKKYRDINEIGYGDLKAEYKSLDTKEELSVELPFENMLFERLFDNTQKSTSVLIGQSVTEAFKRNNSKPIIFFNNGLNNATANPVKVGFNNSGTYNYTTLTSFYNVGNTNDMILNQVTDAVNWGSENDPWHRTRIDNSLYLNYWDNWITTIYSPKQRKFTFEANLPPRYVEELSLNDRLLINDQRYKINDWALNLTTGNVKFTLFKDIYTVYDSEEPNFYGSTFSWTGYYNYLYITDFSTANSDGSYFLYGSLQTYGGTNTLKVIKLRKDGLQDMTFNANLGGPNSVPYGGMRIYRYSDDSLLVAGYYSSYNGVAGYGIRKLHPDGSIDTSLTPRAFTTSGGYSFTEKVEVQPDGKILLVGLFAGYDGNASKGLVRINTDGSYDSSLVVGSTGFNNTTIDVIVNPTASNPTQSMYVSGYFTDYKGTGANGIIRLTATGSVDTSFVYGTGFSPNGTGNSYYLLQTYNDNNAVYVASNTMTSYKGATAGRVIKLKGNGDIDTTFNVGTGVTTGELNFIRYTENNERIFLSGTFSSFNNEVTNKGIIVNLDGSIYQTFPQTGLTDLYNVGDDVYGITMTNQLLTKLTNQNGLNLTTYSITNNAGSKFFSIGLYSDTTWSINKIDLGFGTDWIDVLTPTGTGNTSVEIFIDEKASQTAPALNNPRSMYLKVIAGSIEKWIKVVQTGL